MRLFHLICFIFTCAQQVFSFKLNIQPQKNSDSTLNPVVLIPGTGGTQLWANLSKPTVPHYYCEKQTKEFFNIWLNLELVVPVVISCWIDNVRLNYDKTTRKTQNQPGVDIKIYDFGNTTSIDYIDPSKIRYTVYFENIIKKLEEQGYERGINLHGAPYDFRKSPAEINDFYQDFDNLIENSYNNNGKKPLILICHSMGCLMTFSHLKKKSKEWTDKYIKSFITLGAPWGGSVKSVKTIITGDNLGVSIMDSLSMREVSRTYPSVPYLFPKQGFWREDEPIVTVAFSPYKNMSFTTNDYQELLDSIQLNDVYEMYKDVSSLITDFSPPNVELHCIHGFGVKTMETLHYPQNKFPDGTPVIQYGDGDGTVNLRSLDFCKNWVDKSQKPITYKSFNQTEHMQTTSSEEVVNYIAELIFGKKYEENNETTDSTEYWDDYFFELKKNQTNSN